MLGRVRFYCLALALLIAATGLVYSPGLDGPFVFDDYGNIQRNPVVQMTELKLENVKAAAQATEGSLIVQRPIPRASFALNYYFAGKQLSERSFKTVNLVIHIINAVLVAFLIALLARRRSALPSSDTPSQGTIIRFWLPVLVALIWALHPIQLTSVLYVVQRMTSMAAMFVLLGLIVFVVGRSRLARHKRFGLTLMALGVLGGTLLGIACKESAVLMPLFAALLELFFFSREGLTRRVRAQLGLWYGLQLAVLLLAVVALATISSELIWKLYDVRNFTLWERLMTQPRMLFFYLGLMVYPNLRNFGLYHDDIVLSTGLFDPWTTSIAMIGLVTVLAVGLSGIKRRWMLSFGILWFLVGHSIESSFIGLELVHEHRNYLPSLGVIFVLVFYALRLVELRPELGRLAVPVGVMSLSLLAFVTYARASVWESRDTLLSAAVRNHPLSYRARMAYGANLQVRSGDVLEIYAAYQRSADLNRQNALPVIRMQRYLSGLISQLEEGSVSEDTGIATPEVPDLYRDPLIFDTGYLRKLDALVAAEISLRLTDYATDAETILGLDELRQCIGSAFTTCPSVDRVEEWLTIPLEREGLLPAQRASLLIAFGRLQFHKGDPERAVALMEQALDFTLDHARVWIAIISVYRAARDYEAAEELLNRTLPLVESSGRHIAHFRTLKKLVAEERRQYESVRPQLAKDSRL